jgi:hypothetical protein
MTSYAQRRAGARNGARLAEAAIREETERQQKLREAEYAAGLARRKAARQAKADRVKFTAADLADASHVRDAIGWHRVVRISAKSVTVATSYSWTERIPVERVLQYAINGKAVTSS